MPFAPAIRKQILSALNEHIIPQLQSETVVQVFARPPFFYCGVEPTVEQKILLPNSTGNPLNVILDVKGSQLCIRRVALLGFCYSGSSIETVGVTRQIARDLRHQKLPVPPGISSFHIASPGAIYVPEHVPHNGRSLCEGNEVHRVLLLWFTEEQCWVSHHDAAAGGTHNLNIADPVIRQTKKAYVRALEDKEFNSAQLILLSLMKQLANYLNVHAVTINNSAWPPFEMKSVFVAPHVSPRNMRYCYQIIDHIQFHLNTPLSVESLAEVCRITAPHLCTIFRKSTGITLMNYVTMHRLRAAAMMLTHTNERINDIARLVGFASSQSFAGAFRRRYGMSASKYRRKMVKPGCK